jgi:hypothetical protein
MSGEGEAMVTRPTRSSSSSAQQALLRKKIFKERKYFDSAEWAKKKAEGEAVSPANVGQLHPTPQEVAHHSHSGGAPLKE